ncbi:hypothetical protein POLUDNITSA_00040 [Brevundimonas phage vB_BpoS-Poludnitsa]|nr:hypothetical protein POLUDNITSA_00040 [Brevundimonas phage vB_BpoS-Poludnitsa]
MNTSEHILSMPLPELRERVQLAERMALAARLTPSGTYDGESSAVNTGETASTTPAPAADAPKPRTRRTKEQIAADEAAAKAAEAKAAESSTGPTADEMMAAMSPEPAADEGGTELSLDDIGTGDMMEGFEVEQTTLSPAEARQKAAEIITDIQTKKDTARLAVAREALVKVGAQKASEVPDDKIVEFYNMLPKS